MRRNAAATSWHKSSLKRSEFQKEVKEQRGVWFQQWGEALKSVLLSVNNPDVVEFQCDKFIRQFFLARFQRRYAKDRDLGFYMMGGVLYHLWRKREALVCTNPATYKTFLWGVMTHILNSLEEDYWQHQKFHCAEVTRDVPIYDGMLVPAATAVFVGLESVDVDSFEQFIRYMGYKESEVEAEMEILRAFLKSDSPQDTAMGNLQVSRATYCRRLKSLKENLVMWYNKFQMV